MTSNEFTQEDRAVLRKLATIAGSKRSARKTAACRENGKLGGFWKQKRNLFRQLGNPAQNHASPSATRDEPIEYGIGGSMTVQIVGVAQQQALIHFQCADVLRESEAAFAVYAAEFGDIKATAYALGLDPVSVLQKATEGNWPARLLAMLTRNDEHEELVFNAS